MAKFLLLPLLLISSITYSSELTEFETDIRQCVSNGVHVSTLMTLRQTEIDKVKAREMFQKSGSPLNTVFLDFVYDQKILNSGSAKQAMIDAYKYQTIVRCYELVFENHGMQHLKSTEQTSPAFNR